MSNLPRHVAIVMDGNGRWALQRKLPRIAGHRAGAKSVKVIVEHCVRLNIEVLTLFAFSLENLFRPDSEVKFLMTLFFQSLEDNIDEIHKNNIRLRIIGDRSRFNKKLLQKIQASETLTAANTGLTLVVAINYSGRWDVICAARNIASKVASHELSLEMITQEVFEQHLSLGDLPDPDLLIRTSGEQRISNFMLWQFAYTELFFSPVYWPDFNEAAFDDAIEFFRTRERRFGLTSEQIEKQHV